jgi:hypothetical protein
VAADAAARELAARLADERCPRSSARPALEGGKRERLERDLTGDDDQAPRWSERSRGE